MLGLEIVTFLFVCFLIGLEVAKLRF